MNFHLSVAPRFGALFLLFVLFLLPAVPTQALQNEPLIVRTFGQLDADGTALYSVVVASPADNEFTDLTITSAIPEGSRFVEAFWTPEAATFVGEENGTVTWTLPSLPARAIVGPFSYHVSFAEGAEKPLNVAAHVESGFATAEAALLNRLSYSEATSLVPPVETASITVDAKGTDAPVAVGETGIWLSVPAGAVSQETTLTFTRLPVETSGLPKELYWWCTLVQVEADPAVAFTLPISLSLPTQRALTPGMDAFLFFPASDGQWVDAAEAGVTPDAGYVYLNSDGTSIALADTSLFEGLAQGPVMVAAGVTTSQRAAGTTTIQDGTSNTRNPFLNSYINAYINAY